jgi:hypothetical protein
MNATATVTRRAVSECVRAAGRTDSRIAGGGCEPITLSTAIFSGTGRSRANGVARMLRKVSAAIRGAYGLASRKSRP